MHRQDKITFITKKEIISILMVLIPPPSLVEML
jgi:hypothetical protein